MKDLGIKLTFYDFLGYFIPGTLFCFLVIYNDTLNLMLNHDVALAGSPAAQSSPVETMADYHVYKGAFIETFRRIRTFFKTDGIILGGTAVLLAYIIGHIVTFASYYVVEFLASGQKIYEKCTMRALMEQSYREKFGNSFSFGEQNQHLTQVVSEYLPASHDTSFFYMTTAAYCRSFVLIFFINLIIELVVLWGHWSFGWVALVTNGLLVWLFIVNFQRFRKHFILQFVYSFLTYCKLGAAEKKDKE